YMKEKLETLTKMVAEIQTKRGENKLKLLKAAHTNEDLMQYYDEMDARISNLANNIFNTFDAMYKYIDELYTKLNKHEGPTHFPPLTPSQLNTALKILKLDGDFQVVPKQIYAQKGRILEVTVKSE
ncbi:MAG: hypothetical protein AABY22_27935, partial [Nanoarchaeota archaeon]